MSSKLSEHPAGIAWLRQFTARDIFTARLLLDTLKLISHSSFEASVGGLIDKICDDSSGLVAIFPVDEDSLSNSGPPGSGGRLGHAITNLSRLRGDRILVRPTTSEMRKKRVRQIVLVDDFVASGTRVCNFWDAWATRTLKSWLSYGICELRLACYAINAVGLKRVTDRISYLGESKVYSEIELSQRATYWPQAVEDLCERYGKNTDRRRWPLGFGEIMAPVVFQHGCPNNAPVILWSGGRSWTPLFPERGVSRELYSCFDDPDSSVRGTELLWKAGQHKLALALIDDISNGNFSADYVDLLTLLGLLLRGVTRPNLGRVTTIETSRIAELLEKAAALGLVDEACIVTPFGTDIVGRSKRAFLTNDDETRETKQSAIYYVPRQFCGVRRKSRNAPSSQGSAR